MNTTMDGLVRAEDEMSRRLLAEERLALLESRLAPHMVSNTLASLSALIAVDPMAAQKMVTQFAGYMRNAVGSCREEMRTLESEFAAVSDFLGLMKARMGTRLECAVEMPDSVRWVVIPSGVVQVLVENAITHGLEEVCGPGFLRVAATTEGREVVVRVLNSGGKRIAEEGAGGKGNGLRYVRRRLQEAYGEQCSLMLANVEGTAGGVVAEVRFPGPRSTR